jgi:histidinol-phosphate/aromatic aminotransferase/cobyric acid decarboxylase-like protein
VVEETAAALPDVWAYPEEAYEELRTAIAGWTGADRREVVLGHGIQALTLTLISAFVEGGRGAGAAGAVPRHADAPHRRP